MSLIPFSKYHALGNDYLVIDPQKIKVVFKLTTNKIKTICHRNFGVGSDGILYGPLFEDKKISLKIFNPDGSEAEKSGNGIRIFSRYLQDEKYVQTKKFKLQTVGGVAQVEFLPNHLIQADMGKATFLSHEIPVTGPKREVINESLKIKNHSYQVTCVSVGNPHCVIPLPQISGELAKKIGPLVETHSLFPNRINMQLVKVMDRQNIRIEIWERGAGYTLASGSSSCAAAVATHRLGLVDHHVTVHMPGGSLAIETSDKYHILMTGPVTPVANGNITLF